MIIAIDGPSGAGKGTLAQYLATYLDFALLDTGLLYRALGKKCLDLGVDLGEQKEVTSLASTLTAGDLDQDDLRTEQIAEAASVVSAYPAVRQALFLFQKNFAENPPKGKKGAILDGRDIGTVICPQADVKIFITADLETRALRRFKELQRKQIDVIYKSVLQTLRERDFRDQNRTASPLRPAQDAYILDSTALDQEQVFEKALGHVLKKSKRN